MLIVSYLKIQSICSRFAICHHRFLQRQQPDPLSPYVLDMEISLFGQLRITLCGAEYSIKGRKLRELLALMLINKGKPLKKLWLAETLWPQADQAQALDSLYKVCAAWKKDLELQKHLPLVTRTSEISLERLDIGCDAYYFENAMDSGKIAELEAAVALYTGPLLFQEYYEWTAVYEAHYEMHYIKSLTTLITYYQACGDQAKSDYFRRKQELI